ncbi:shugoshin-1 [Heracleum sosnowskyi]|uniref:Shugoshin-1 n=1 Tax=Heracleum sosnowskyi TaxID=360622 RepID=A0AAD8J474_9APIA|nr:shugoshin-1 [Heracleum sosnowskyi]
MSMKENLYAINSNKIIIPLDNEKPRVRKSTEVCGSTERKRLANITNMQQFRMSMPDEKSQFIPASTKEYIDKLKKENMTLMKLLADRNKIIELSGIELHKLRVSVQKLQQQNLQLAQSNSQMLSELTVDKDRLKLLQHELGCKSSLLVAKGLELKEKDENLPSQKVDEEVKVHNEKLDSSQASRDNVKPVNISRRQPSKSLGPSTVKESKDKKADNKRQCVRRQSARLKSQEPEPADGLSEVEPTSLAFGPLHNDGMEEDFSKSSTVAIKGEKISGSKRIPVRRQSARFKSEEPKPAEDAIDSTGLVSGPNCADQMQDDVSTSICLSAEEDDKASGNRRLSATRQPAKVKSEAEPVKALQEVKTNDQMQNDVSTTACLSTEKDSTEGKHAPNRESQDFGRPSFGRPSRQAAKKVSCYKEIPLNVKMRRTE